MTELKPCPFCGNKKPELVDDRVEYFVRCLECKPYFTVIYGDSVRHLDHLDFGDDLTDEEIDKLSQAEFEKVDWPALKQSAIDAWNRRDGSVDFKIEDIDYAENDAYLLISDCRLYFQWDGKDVPTIKDAIQFIKSEAK